MTHSELMFALIVGLVSAAAVIGNGYFVARSSGESAKLAMRGIERQLELNAAIKIADFRQQWINSLRESMAALQAMSVTERSLEQPEFYRLGTRIELLMNRNDPRYPQLDGCIIEFMRAKTERERWQCSATFTTVCQDILKTEWEVLKRDLARVTATSEK